MAYLSLEYSVHPIARFIFGDGGRGEATGIGLQPRVLVTLCAWEWVRVRSAEGAKIVISLYLGNLI